MCRFQESVIGKVSKAALSLCKWVRGMYVYSQVAKEVEPKRIRLEQINAMLDEAERKLAIKVIIIITVIIFIITILMVD